MLGKFGHPAGEPVGHRRHIATVELHEHREARRPLDQRRQLCPMPSQQPIAFPVPGQDAIRHLKRPLMNRHGALDLGSPVAGHRVMHAAPHRTPRLQVGAQLAGQHAA